MLPEEIMLVTYPSLDNGGMFKLCVMQFISPLSEIFYIGHILIAKVALNLI